MAIEYSNNSESASMKKPPIELGEMTLRFSPPPMPECPKCHHDDIERLDPVVPRWLVCRHSGLLLCRPDPLPEERAPTDPIAGARVRPQTLHGLRVTLATSVRRTSNDFDQGWLAD